MRRVDRNKINNVEKEFFETDEDNKVAKVHLHFEMVNDIFDSSFLAGTPVFNEEFSEQVKSIFNLVPRQYEIALEISFDSTGDFNSEELREIFRKNLRLSAGSYRESLQKNNHLAYVLVAAGFLSFIMMMVIGWLWNEENFWHDVFFYILDISTTVLFWEAAGILLVENREKRMAAKSYNERFKSIDFD